MNKSARKAVNLSVLQRHDPHISDILDSSSYVVVYKFDEDSQAWTKKGVEGTMFVFRRSTLPSYGFFIMNRLGIDNMMADLTADMALQLTSDYIIYRDERDIHGIWVYEPADRDRIGEKLMDCCKKAKEGAVSGTNGVAEKPSPSVNSDHSSIHRPQEQPSASSASTEDAASTDPLSRMLSEAMSRARVSESSGVPSTPQSTHQQPLSEASSTHAHTTTPPTASMQGGINSARSRSSGSQQGSPELRRDTTSPPASTSSSSAKNEIPSFLLAIIENKEASSGSQSGSPHLRRESLKDPAIGDSSSTQAMLLNSLTGSGKSVNGERPGSGTRSHGPPLSAEFLPASVMPSGLYSSSNNNSRSNGVHPGSAAPPGQQQQQRRSPPSGMANPSMMNRSSNGMPAHGSPLQAPAFAYSPGMMPSPLGMPPMQVGPMMHPPPPHHSVMNGGGGAGGPHLHHPPPPPLPFPPGLANGPVPPMGLPLPSQGAPSSFPADAMHAAMGAVGFMQQQQRGFVNRGPPGEVMPKAEFTQQFMGLLQTDPQFMDVLYSNYTAVFARRG
ncbi:hypothetical protein BGX29_001105 [Mortierella sp. GBA35]|nr:hypothetical protein BGX29_001105 [Mortierella sp. GBA35]